MEDWQVFLACAAVVLAIWMIIWFVSVWCELREKHEVRLDQPLRW